MFSSQQCLLMPNLISIDLKSSHRVSQNANVLMEEGKNSSVSPDKTSELNPKENRNNIFLYVVLSSY